MAVLADHGDAVIAAFAALLGVFSRLPMDRAAHRAQREHDRVTWLRDQRLEAGAEVLSAAREVRAAYEQAYEARRGGSNAAYLADPACEAALTRFARAVDTVRLLPGVDAAVLDAFYEATRVLVVRVRRSDFHDRRELRDGFDATLAAFVASTRNGLG